MDDTAMDDASMDDTSMDDASMDDTSMDDTSMDDASMDDTSMDDASMDDTSMNDASTDDASTDGVSMGDAAMGDAAMGDASMEDVPTEDVPSEDAGPSEDITEPEPAAPTWDGQVQAIIQASCGSCHGNSGGWSANSYADSQKMAYSGTCSGMTKGECFSVRIKDETMPTNVSVLQSMMDSGDLETLDAWIAGGMPEN
jgi:hypothetical protein